MEITSGEQLLTLMRDYQVPCVLAAAVDLDVFQTLAGSPLSAEQTAQRTFDEKMAEQLQSLFIALDRVVAETNEAKALWLHRWEQSAVAVAAAMAERIIRRQLEREPEITLQWIREALQMAAGAADVALHLNPADYSLLGSRAKQLAQSLSGLAPTTIVADPAVSPGGCVVQTRLGRIDQQIESQLARIQEELT